MQALLFQILIVGIWSMLLTIHIRRLFRLAAVVRARHLQRRALRHDLSRIWWWLGREEFWARVKVDALQCIQLTLMLLLLLWNL